jgi:hypothetical protein
MIPAKQKTDRNKSKNKDKQYNLSSGKTNYHDQIGNNVNCGDQSTILNAADESFFNNATGYAQSPMDLNLDSNVEDDHNNDNILYEESDETSHRSEMSDIIRRTNDNPSPKNTIYTDIKKIDDDYDDIL